jgi:DNA-binding PadR family transcriptional regulator
MCGQIISESELENLYEISCLGLPNIYVGDEDKALAIAKCYEDDGNNFIQVRAFQLYKCLEDVERDELIIYDSEKEANNG